MLLRAPMVMGSLSPRRTAFHQTEAPAPRRTSPMTVALAATQAEGSMAGDFASMRKMGMMRAPQS